jgi:hypothetical protein
MRRFLGAAAALVLALDLAVVAVRMADDPLSGRDALGPGQAIVTGTAESIAADVQETDLVPAPFTIAVPSRGGGGATVRDAIVDGKRAAIVWDSGRPLVISSASGGLDLGPVHLEADRDGISYALDGAIRSLLPGNYRIATPVAVGGGGLATARDDVDFGTDRTTSVVTRGGAFVHIAPRSLALIGPGRLSARGQFSVRTADEERDVDTLIFGPGAFEVQLSRDGPTYRIEAILQGPIH